MGFYLEICNNPEKYEYFDSLSEDEYFNCIHIEKKIRNPIYFKIDEIFQNYITQYNKKFDLYLVKCKFEVEFIIFTEFIKTEYFFNTSFVIMKKYLTYYIYRIISRGRKISHMSKMKIKTISNMGYMNYNYYLRQPMQKIERRLNMNDAKNPEIINSLNRGSDHLLIRKHIHILFND